MNFTISKRARTLSMALIVVGLVATLVGLLGDHSDHHQRTWANLLVNGFFFLGISLGALFFFALQNATETAWYVMVRRVYEALMGWLPIGALVMVIVLAAGTLHLNHIWHWMDSAVHEPNDAEHYDELIANKGAYLNLPFFWLRTLVYLGVFLFFARWFRRKSMEMDGLSGSGLVSTHKLMYRRGALFLVFFAVFSSTLAWDWLMSIDTHWFSTLYGWYVFSGMWVSAMIAAVVLVLYLKRKGYLPQVNNSHIHDMGKWVFAISFLWTYLYFSQFMLIWYSNIPEEVTYFQQRINEHPGLLWTVFGINFAVPMVLLMSRDAKRNPRFLIGVGAVIFIGHWLDVILMVMPGALGQQFHGVGLLEVGMFTLFLGAFLLVTLRTLAQAPLSPVNHPFLEESVHHQI
jgi:hypothetical protein